MKEIFLILALLEGAPEPAPEFRAPISDETAAAMLDTITSGEEAAPDPALDFNGDGALNIADFCGISRRAYINTHEQTAVTVDAETVEAIAAELYPEDIKSYFYYEFDHINGELCRAYEATADEITTARIYFEFEDWSTSAAQVAHILTQRLMNHNGNFKEAIL